MFFFFIFKKIFILYLIVIFIKDGTKLVYYSPQMTEFKKTGLILNVIGTFESYNQDLENKTARPYEI